MENAALGKKQKPGTSSGAWATWDPFWLVRQMFGWGQPADAPSFDVEETDDTFVCKVNVKLTLPGQADVAHAKAELENGKLTLVVPKAATATPEPGAQPEAKPQASSSSSSPSEDKREAISAAANTHQKTHQMTPRKAARTAENRHRGSAGGAGRRGARRKTRRG